MKPFNGKLPTQNTGRAFSTAVTSPTSGAVFDVTDIANLSRDNVWPPSGPVLSNILLRMDASNYSGSGTTWNDLSGNNYHATLVGSPSFSSNNEGYFTFDGTGNQYASLPYSGLLNPGDNWTITAGVYSDNINNFGIIFSAWQVIIGSAIRGYNLGFGGTSFGHCSNQYGLRSQCGRNSWANYIRQSNSNVVSGATWYILAAVATNSYNNSFSIAYYVNNAFVGAGVWCAGDTSGSNAYANDTNKIFIGRNNNPNYDMGVMYGRIGFVSINSKNLSTGELTQNYNYYRSRYGIG